MKRVALLVGSIFTILATPLWAADDALVVYSGRSDKFVRPVMAAFTRDTGIKVILHAAKSTALLNKLMAEKDRTEADVFISNDAGTLQTGSDKGLFRPIDSAITNQVSVNYRSPENTWLGLSARARVLVVNKNARDTDWIKSVFDLADPRLQGRLGITDSTNESYIAGVTVYLLSAGKEKTRQWLQGMKDNVGTEVFAKHSKIVKAVADGKKDVGLVNHYYIYRHLEKHPDAPVRVLLPDQGDTGMGVAWNVAGIAVSKYSKKQQQVEQLLKFLISDKGQAMFAEVNREYPVKPGVQAAAEVPAAGSFKVANVLMSLLGRERSSTLDLIEAVGMP
jgi:iron(III) transport system substrate-binding protein